MKMNILGALLFAGLGVSEHNQLFVLKWFFAVLVAGWVATVCTEMTLEISKLIKEAKEN